MNFIKWPSQKHCGQSRHSHRCHHTDHFTSLNEQPKRRQLKLNREDWGCQSSDCYQKINWVCSSRLMSRLGAPPFLIKFVFSRYWYAFSLYSVHCLRVAREAKEPCVFLTSNLGPNRPIKLFSIAETFSVR